MPLLYTQPYITRDMLFGSDGDWGGIYISRALFSSIPVATPYSVLKPAAP